MNRTEEERLVAMYFDNSDFEKHARQTIKTLDELKDSMNLEKSVKGFDVFDKMKRNSGLDQMQKGADKLKNTFSSIGTIITKTFSFANGPLKGIENAFQSLSGYVNKYLGFDLASKVVGSFESAIRGLTVAPLSEGWAQYENEVDSVRTIMSSTGKSIQEVNKYIQDMTEYADQTVYSLNDMTSNLGKFVNNGVELGDATKAMMGIANAAADAGQGTQQASMAMYNFSQAIGVGKMTSIDWKSIENANMATVRLKETFMEVAAEQNKITKEVDKQGNAKYYYTKDSKGNQLKDRKKWTEISATNFRDTLSEGWLDSGAMVAALKIYSGQNLTIQSLEAMGITDKSTQERLLKVGQEALAAAQRVSTFSKMMANLKDAAASGWATTFRTVFGDANESTELWTSLTEKIGGVLNGMSERRNKLLKDWKETREVLGTEMVDSGSVYGGTVEKVIYGRNGREILLDSLRNISSVIGQIGTSFRKAFGDVFGVLSGNDLFTKTQNFEKTTLRIKEYFGDLNDEGSRMNKIYRVIRGIVSAFALWKKSIRSLIDTVVRIFVPSFGGVLEVLANVGDFIYALNKMEPGQIFEFLGEKIAKVWEKIKGFFNPKELFGKMNLSSIGDLPAVKWLKNVYSQLSDMVGGFSFSIDFGGVGDWLSGAWETVKDTWGDIKDGAGKALEGLGSFLDTPWEWIKEQAGATSNVVESISESASPVVTKASQWIEGAWAEVSRVVTTTLSDAKDLLPKISGFFSDPMGWIKGLISGGEEAAETVSGSASSVIDSIASGSLGDITLTDLPIVQWFNLVWGEISKFFGGAIPEEFKNVVANIQSFFEQPWQWIEDNILSGNLFEGITSGNFDVGVLAWFEGIWEKIKYFWGTLKAKAAAYLPDVLTFFEKPWNWLKDAFGAAKDFFTKPTGDGDSSFVLWLKGIWQSIKDFWGTLKAKAAAYLPDVLSFFETPWNWLKDAIGGAVEFFKDPGDNRKSSFILWLEGIWDKIKYFWGTLKAKAKAYLPDVLSFFETPWNWLKDAVNAAANWFKGPGPSNVSTTFVQWLEGVWEKIKDIWQTYFVEDKYGIFESIGEFLSDTWAWIVKLFNSITGNGSSAEAEDVSEGIDETADVVKDAGEAGETLSENAEASISVFERVIEVLKGFLDKAKEFVGSIVNWDEVTHLFDGLKTFISGAFTALGDLFSAVGKYLKGEKISFTEFSSLIRVLGVILLPQIISMLTSLGAGLLHKHFGLSFASLGSEIRDVGIGIAAIMGAVVALKTAGVKSEDFEEYAIWIAGAAALIGGIITALGYLNKHKAEADDAADDDNPWTDLLGNVVSGLTKIGTIWIVMKMLPDVLTAAAEANQIGGGYAKDLILSLVGIFGAIAALSFVIAGIAKMKIDFGSSLSAFVTVLEALLIVLGTVKGIDLLWGSVGEAKDAAEKCESIGTAIGALIGGLIGGIIEPIGEAIGKAKFYYEHGTDYETYEKTEMEKLDNSTQNAIDLITAIPADKIMVLAELIGQVDDIANIGFSPESVLYNFDMSNFATGYKILVEALLMIVNALANDDFKLSEKFNDEEFRQSIVNAVDMVKTITSIFAAIDVNTFRLFNTKVGQEDFFGNFGEFIQNGGLENFLTDVAKIYKVLNEKHGSSGWAEFSTRGLGYYVGQKKQYENVISMVLLIMQMFKDTDKYIESLKSMQANYSTNATDERYSNRIIAFDNFLTEIENMYAVIDKHPALMSEKAVPAATFLNSISNLMSIFGDEGVGSTEWRQNFDYFKSVVASGTFVDEYVTAVEKIYEALQNSTLNDDEGITFDGLQIVHRLFDSIQNGFDDIQDLPSINAQPVVDAIVLSISGGKRDLVVAIHDMIQAGLDEVDDNTSDFSSPVDVLSNVGQLTDLFSQLQSGELFSGFDADKLLGESGLGSILNVFESDDMKQLTADLRSSIPNIGEMLTSFTDANGNPIDVMQIMKDKFGEVKTAFEETPITITVVPTFDLDELTPASVQNRLNKFAYKLPISMPDVSINYDGLKEAIDIEELKYKLDQIASKLDTWGSLNNSSTIDLGNHMDGIRNQIGNMKLWLDGNRLVGWILPSIDKGLGQRARAYERTGTIWEADR